MHRTCLLIVLCFAHCNRRSFIVAPQTANELRDDSNDKNTVRGRERDAAAAAVVALVVLRAPNTRVTQRGCGTHI